MERRPLLQRRRELPIGIAKVVDLQVPANRDRGCPPRSGGVPPGAAGNMKSVCRGALATTGTTFGAHARNNANTETQKHRNTENKPLGFLCFRLPRAVSRGVSACPELCRGVFPCKAFVSSTAPSHSRGGGRGQANHRQQPARHIGLQRRAIAHRGVAVDGGVAIRIQGEAVGLVGRRRQPGVPAARIRAAVAPF